MSATIRQRLLIVFLVVVVTAGLFCLSGAAQSGQPGEYGVKAAFLFNFTKFVAWPDDSFRDRRSPIVLGIIGEDPFDADTEHFVVAQMAQGRPIALRKYRFGDNLRSCHLLFISASERQHVAQILATLQDASVLTVSDIDGFAEAGGVMQFVMQDNRVHFVVNLDAATQGKLRVSAKLLALARVINHGGLAR
jgi:hypothetical protein